MMMFVKLPLSSIRELIYGPITGQQRKEDCGNFVLADGVCGKTEVDRP